MITRSLAVIAAVVTLASTAACGSTDSAGSSSQAATGSSTSLPETTATMQDESAVEPTVEPAVVQVGTVVPRTAARTVASSWITRKAGGTVSVDLGDGVTATLEIPRGAVDDGVIVTLSTFTSGSVTGLRMEPDGLWFTRPAVLTITGAPRLLARIGALPEGDLFAIATPLADGSIPIVRLRPVIIEDASVTPTEVGGAGGGAGGAGGAGSGESDEQEPDFFGPRDPSDEGAHQAEADAANQATSEGTDVSKVEVTTTGDVRKMAGGAAAVMAPRCKDPKDPASVRAAATRRTAGALAPPELPDCITRVVRVLGLFETEYFSEAKVLLNVSETVGGMGEVSSSGEESTFPLEGIIAIPPNNPLKCSVGRMEGGTMSAKMEEGAGGDLTVTLKPSGGTYPEWCPKLSATGQSVVWTLIRKIRGMGEEAPFVVTFPPGRSSANVFGSFESSEVAGGRLLSNGRYQFQDSELRLALLMVVDLYESMEEYRETQKVWESAAPKPSGS